MKLSSRLKNNFEDVLVSEFSVKEIRRFFDNNDIENKITDELPVSGIRRALINQYYKSVDWNNRLEVKNILQAFSDILTTLEEKKEFYYDGSSENRYTKAIEELSKNLTKDNLSYDGSTIRAIEIQEPLPIVSKPSTLIEQNVIPMPASLDKTIEGSEHNDAPTVFISYSWDDEPHKEWVLNLANDLIDNGVDVLLDQYELRAGRNMTHFMERAVRQADNVLCILTPNYKIKADGRAGGVGFEYSMISQSLFSNQSSEKFIPILRNGNQSESSPTYLNAILYHDMIDDSLYGNSLHELLRILYKEPLIKKPILGKRPVFSKDIGAINNNVALRSSDELSALNANNNQLEIVKILNSPTSASLNGSLFNSVDNECSIEIKNISKVTIDGFTVEITFPLFLADTIQGYPTNGKDYILKYKQNEKIYPEQHWVTEKFNIQVNNKNYDRALESCLRIVVYSDLGKTSKDYLLRDFFIVSNEYGQDKYLLDSQFNN